MTMCIWCCRCARGIPRDGSDRHNCRRFHCAGRRGNRYCARERASCAGNSRRGFPPGAAWRANGVPSPALRLAMDANGAAIDEVMAVFMKAPNTYTREDVAEIHCHGGGVCARAVLRRILQLGARLAEPGEFTRRAFLSGRIDLSRAEAVMQLVGAQGEAARRAALRQMRGGVSFFVMDAVRRIENLLSQIQAAVDFPDEIDEEPVAAQVRAETGAIAAEISRRIDPAGARILREGASVVLAGRPNVGKSSLMNAILRCERAIVTDIPGTTRDVLTERLELDGRVVRLSDTAGIRESEDAIEQIGVERARGEMEGADVVLLVIDASLPLTDADREMLSHADERCIFCLNKIDLGLRLDEGALPKGEIVRVSAATGEGMEALLEALRRRLHSNVEEDTFTAERPYPHCARGRCVAA